MSGAADYTQKATVSNLPWNAFQTRPFVFVTPNGPTDGGDYGPNTAGTTTAGIQEAATKVGNAGGGMVFIKAGTYVVTSGVSVPSDVTIMGEGQDATVIQVKNTTYGFGFTGTLGANTTLSGNAATGATSLSVASSASFSAGQWIWIAAAASGSNNQVARINKVASVSAGVINLVWPLQYQMETNDIVYVNTPLKNIRIANLQLQGVSGKTAYAIQSALTVNCEVRSCKFTSLQSKAFDLYSNNGSVLKFRVMDCYFDIGSAGTGVVSAWNAQDLEVAGCIDIANPGTMVSALHPTAHVHDNYSLGFTALGQFLVLTGSIESVIENNKCIGVGSGGISFQTVGGLTNVVVVGNIIKGNTIMANGGSPIDMVISADATTVCTGNIIEGNYLINNFAGAIYLYNALRTVVKGNYVEGTGTGGGTQGAINVTGGSHYCTVVGNSCFNNYYNFYMDGIAQNAVVEGNIFQSGSLTNTNVLLYVAPQTAAGTGVSLHNNVGYNPVTISSIAAGASPYTFPLLPYDAVYVLKTLGGMTALTLDGQSVFSATLTVAGETFFVAANHTLIATWATTAPVFEILPI